jgi:urease accessory protein
MTTGTHMTTGMPTRPTAMTDRLAPETLLGVLHLSSPALPVGAFSYSEALESGVDQGWVRDEASAQQWLADAFELGLVRCDWPFVDALLQAWSDEDLDQVKQLNRRYLISRETQEIRQQTLQMGHAMLKWLDNHPGVDPQHRAALDTTSTCWPVAFTLAHQQFQTPAAWVRLSLAFSWLENQVQSAMKAVPLGQQSGQRLIHALNQRILDAHAHYAALPTPPEPISCAPGWAILSSRHEHQYTRIFRS